MSKSAPKSDIFQRKRARWSWFRKFMPFNSKKNTCFTSFFKMRPKKWMVSHLDVQRWVLHPFQKDRCLSTAYPTLAPCFRTLPRAYLRRCCSQRYQPQSFTADGLVKRFGYLGDSVTLVENHTKYTAKKPCKKAIQGHTFCLKKSLTVAMVLKNFPVLTFPRPPFSEGQGTTHLTHLTPLSQGP